MDRITQFLNNLPRVLDDDGGFASRPSEEVITNSIDFIKSLPTYYQKIINPEECITATTHGTITIDWFYRKNLLSVEVGTTKIGWFSDLPDGLNSSCDGMILSPLPPAEIIICLDKIYSRSEYQK